MNESIRPSFRHRMVAAVLSSAVVIAGLLVPQAAHAATSETAGAARVVTPTMAATSFVLAAYTDILQRTPPVSDSGVQYWVANIVAGVPRASIAASITGSDEYRLLRIREAYEDVLGREPEAAGQAWWLDAMRSGVLQPDDAHRTFLSTDEFYANQGRGTVAGYVGALYLDIIGRRVDADGLAYWTNAVLTSGRAAVVDQIWFAPETLAHQIDQTYQQMLGRTAAASEEDYWASTVRAVGPSGFRTVVLGSDEYFTRALSRFPQPASAPSTPTPPTTPSTPSVPGSFPSASSTGVPVGTVLAPYAGSCTVTVSGTVIDAKTINCGTLTIRAKNVVISRSVVNGTVYADDDGSGSFTISDSQVNIGAQAGTGIGDANFTAVRVHVTGGNRSINCFLNCTVLSSYVHGQFTDSTGVYHESGIRMGSGSVIRGNTIACDAPDVAPDAGCSAALTGYGDFAVVQNNTIDGNYFVAGSGGYCSYGGSTSGKPFSVGTNHIVFTNNVYQRGSNGKCGYWGPITAFDVNAPGNVWSNNTYDNGTTARAAD